MKQKRLHVARDSRKDSARAHEGESGGRLLVLACIVLALMGTVLVRLTYLQLFKHGEYLARAQRQQQRTIEITPKRGTIYDRNLRPLAMSISVDSAFAVPAEIVDEQLAAHLLSGIVNIPEEVLKARFESSKSFVWISRKLPPEKAEAVTALNLKGVYLQKENQRFYPKRELAAHVLGFVDPDEKGLGGLEYELDGPIRGKGEKIMVLADARQRWFDGGQAQREGGADVELTLDEKIQYIAERELAASISKTHAIAGTVMVMNPNTGEILALANWPTFNPNEATKVPAELRINRAVSSLYEPGSTFKLITLAAAFDQGITNPEEVFDCENGAVYVAGHRIRDHKPFGFLNVADILAQSSDVGAIKIALRLGAPRFYDYIRAFGFGAPTGVDLPGESKGKLRLLEKWKPISIGSIAMGQEVGVTPIQLITAVSAIANGGLLRRPHVVAQLQRGDQIIPLETAESAANAKRVIRPETAATLRKLMEGVVLNGTGKLAHLDGWTSAGKTGSAQKMDEDTKRYSPTQYIASFTGFAPINNPAVTVLVSLDSPEGLHEGGEVAAPVFKRIAEQVLAYLDVPRDVPLNPKLVQVSLKKQTDAHEMDLEDFSPLDFSEQPEPSAAASQIEGANPATRLDQRISPVTVAFDEAGDVAVPDFSGKTMREVTEICLRLGLDPVLVGSNLAADQSPAAGAMVKRGTRVTVQFGTPKPKNSQPRADNRN
jgi:cell division protein FtsI (penicillin-binding protein 3)